MNSQEAFVLVMVLLAFSAYGWGVTLVHLSTRFRWLSDRPVRLDPALNIALGVALFLAVGGLFVAVNLAYIGFLIGWQILGAVLCAASIFRRQLWTGWKTLLMPRLIPGWIAILIVLYMSLGPALCGAWNANDDGGGYIYLGQRLLATGGLIDPFNTRRLNSYGGAELFQAIIGRTVGTAAGIGVEWFLFLLLTIALLVRSIRRRGAAIVLLTIGFGIALIRPVGEWANVAPSFSGVALTLAAARLISEYRSERNSRWVFLLAGLLFGALFSLRLEFTVAGGIMVFLSLFSPRLRGQRFSLFACTVIGSACALCGWAVALERSSGTPLFPLFKGNWTQASWFVDPQLHSLTQHLNETGLILRVDRIGVGLFGALIATVVVAIYAKKIPARAAEMAQEPVPLKSIDVSLALIFGCLALVLSQAYVNSGSTFADIGRYVGPSILACVLFSVSQVWDLALVLQTDRSNPSKTFGPRLVAVTFAICGIVFALLFIDPNSADVRSELKVVNQQSWSALTGKAVLLRNWSAEFQAAQSRYYTKINMRVPSGSHVLAAVLLPNKLDFKKFTFTTLDEPGAASPAPHLPLTGGVDRALSYLRDQGIDGIIATAGSAYGPYNLEAAQDYLNASVPYYRIGAKTTVEWDALVLQFQHRFLTYKVGRLRYISFDRPRTT